MRYGFKTQAEKAAAAARVALKVRPLDPLDARRYADHLGVLVLDFRTLDLSTNTVRQLTIIDSDSWSAMTLKEGSQYAVVLNPEHKPTRQQTDLMHELAHIELRHTPARVEVSKNGLLLLSDYSDEHEQEADWHAGALLLPRSALIHHRGRQRTAKDIAELFGVSEALCEWRLRMTGVDVQLRRAWGRQ